MKNDTWMKENEDKDIWQAFEEVLSQYPDSNMYSIPELLEERKGIEPMIKTSRQRKRDLDEALKKIEKYDQDLKELRKVKALVGMYVDDIFSLQNDIKKLKDENEKLRQESLEPVKKIENIKSFLTLLSHLLWVLIVFFIFIAVLTSFAKADEVVKVHLVHVSGVDNAVTTEAREVFKLTRREYKNRLGVRLKRVSFRSIQNPYPTLNYLDQRVQQFEAMYPEVLNIQKNKGEIVYFFMPPLIEGDKRYKSGRANKRCGLDYWNTYAVGWHKQNDIERSVGLMMHELAHTLSADHVDDESVMSSYLPAGTNRYFNNFSLNQIKECVK